MAIKSAPLMQDSSWSAPFDLVPGAEAIKLQNDDLTVIYVKGTTKGRPFERLQISFDGPSFDILFERESPQYWRLDPKPKANMVWPWDRPKTLVLLQEVRAALAPRSI
ncbi:MAG TPA: hypothetical protein VG965_01040 [Patescibacteria group bacterium]|nr:hypothetical protein [Patescibacteria group bacterium]